MAVEALATMTSTVSTPSVWKGNGDCFD